MSQDVAQQGFTKALKAERKECLTNQQLFGISVAAADRTFRLDRTFDRLAPRTIIMHGIMAPPMVSRDSFTIARGAVGPTRRFFTGFTSPTAIAPKQHWMGNVNILPHLTLRKARLIPRITATQIKRAP